MFNKPSPPLQVSQPQAQPDQDSSFYPSSSPPSHSSHHYFAGRRASKDLIMCSIVAGGISKINIMLDHLLKIVIRFRFIISWLTHILLFIILLLVRFSISFFALGWLTTSLFLLWITLSCPNLWVITNFSAWDLTLYIYLGPMIKIFDIIL